MKMLSLFFVIIFIIRIEKITIKLTIIIKAYKVNSFRRRLRVSIK